MKKTPDEVDEELTRERFELTWKELKETKLNKYEFLFKGGRALKEAIFALFCSVWRMEECPTSWYKTQIIQIHKGKGPIEDLDMYRNIHLKNIYCKMFCHMVVRETKEKLNKHWSKFQMARPGHRCQENLFILRSMMVMN